MKIDIDEHNNLRLKEVFSGILLETEEGNQLGICMRDDTFEMNICPQGKDSGNWWRIDMQTGKVESEVCNKPNNGAMTDTDLADGENK